MDTISKERRSWNMSRIGSKDTLPEKLVRSFLHRAGYRFRLHVKALPGSPDIVLPKYGIAIFVHGCFWHRHKGCRYAYMPKSRIGFWEKKFKENMLRDQHNTRSLSAKGWKVEVIWECQTKDEDVLRERLKSIFFSKSIAGGKNPDAV